MAQLQLAKGIDAAHSQTRKKPLPVVQFDYAEAGDIPRDDEYWLPNFDFAVATCLSTGYPWSSAVLSHGKEDIYAIMSFVSYLGEIGHNKIVLQKPEKKIVRRRQKLFW